MKSKAIAIPEGAIFTITTGEYSCYQIDGVFRAIKVIDPDALMDEWLKEHPEQSKHYRFRDGEFLSWIAKRGFLLPVESYEWHLTDYQNIKEMWLEKAAS